MSKIISIILKEGEKQQHILHNTKQSILDTFVEDGLAKSGFCRGISTCGRCKVRFLKGATIPCAQDRKVFEPKELREGFRLACHAKPMQDCAVELYFPKEDKMTIVSESEKETYTEEKGDEAESRDGKTFAVVDIGTTTVVMQLAQARDKKIVGTVKFMNPQRKYGFDVVSRIQAAAAAGEEMREGIRQAITEGMKELQKQAGKTEPPELLCVTGNTVMLHIFMGYDTEELGRSPFRPVSIKTEETITEGIKTVIMPSVSAFVGADVTAGILQTKMQETDRINLLIDLGTNGEMALGNGKKILACAAAAGPAFEGGAEAGIYGADILSVIGRLLEEKRIDENGSIEGVWNGIYKGKQIEITQEKIREIQLAKAAVRAGVELLIKKYGIPSYDAIANVYLAGGFGFFLEGKAAVQTGLLPKELQNKTMAVGNSALAGAVCFGKAYLDKETEKMPDMDKIESFNLAEEKEFQDSFLQYINFPEESGSF